MLWCISVTAYFNWLNLTEKINMPGQWSSITVKPRMTPTITNEKEESGLLNEALRPPWFLIFKGTVIPLWRRAAVSSSTSYSMGQWSQRSFSVLGFQACIHAVWARVWRSTGLHTVTCGEVRVHPQAAVLAAPLFETGNLSCIPLCAKLVAPNSLDSLSSLFSISPLSTGITGTCFTRVLGIWTQVSRLVWQALYLQAIHYPTLGQYP